MTATAADDFLEYLARCHAQSVEAFGAILADPPWQFQNRTGKVAPEHRRLSRYETLSLADIMAIPVTRAAAEHSHLYLWVPNALLPEGLAVMQAWGFEYKTNLVWHKVRKDGHTWNCLPGDSALAGRHGATRRRRIPSIGPLTATTASRPMGKAARPYNLS